jgi:uncharacterized OB-fold protein
MSRPRTAPSDAPAARSAREKRLRAARISAGLCAKCGDYLSYLHRWCKTCRSIDCIKRAARKAAP